jgi:hypothetical protein
MVSDDARIGTLLSNQYRLDALLGHGGMGSVYSGTQLSVTDFGIAGSEQAPGATRSTLSGAIMGTRQ